MKLWIFPVVEDAGAAETGTGEVRRVVFVERDDDVFPDDEVFTAFAKTGLVEAPPLGMRIVLIEQTQAATSGQEEAAHSSK